MMLKTNAIQRDVRLAIKGIGMSCVITTDTGTLRTYVVVVNKTSKDNSMGLGAQFTALEDEMLIPGDIRTAPKVGDRITFDKQTFTITQVNAIKPATKVLVYGIQVS